MCEDQVVGNGDEVGLFFSVGDGIHVLKKQLKLKRNVNLCWGMVKGKRNCWR